MLELADDGDRLPRDVGCGVVSAHLRDSAYKIIGLAERELKKHAVLVPSVGRAEKTVSTPKRKKSRGAMSTKKKILIVDDEQDLLNFLTALFQDNGYDTVTAMDGGEALEKTRSEKPDLITLDMTMPEQSGVRAYRNLKDDPELRKIPVVIITGIGESMKNFLAKRRQVPEPEGFLSKPFEQNELLAIVSKLLA